LQGSRPLQASAILRGHRTRADPGERGYNQRKALIEALVAQVKITGSGGIVPVIRIPQPEADTAAEATRTMVRTATQTHKTEPGVRAVTNLVGLTCQHPNPPNLLIVNGPEILIRPVGSRRGPRKPARGQKTGTRSLTLSGG
jgi:hypothetical protein